MANGGRPRPTCDRLHRELSAGVNFQNKGRCVACRTTATTTTIRLINDKCVERSMTAMIVSYRPASAPQNRVATELAEPRQRRSHVVLSGVGAIDLIPRRALKTLNFEANIKTENVSYLFLLQASLLERPKVSNANTKSYSLLPNLVRVKSQPAKRPLSACPVRIAPLPRKKKKHYLALRPQKPLRLIRDGKVGGREFLYLTPTRYTVTTRMTPR